MRSARPRESRAAATRCSQRPRRGAAVIRGAPQVQEQETFEEALAKLQVTAPRGFARPAARQCWHNSDLSALHGGGFWLQGDEWLEQAAEEAGELEAKLREVSAHSGNPWLAEPLRVTSASAQGRGGALTEGARWALRLAGAAPEPRARAGAVDVRQPAVGALRRRRGRGGAAAARGRLGPPMRPGAGQLRAASARRAWRRRPCAGDARAGRGGGARGPDRATRAAGAGVGRSRARAGGIRWRGRAPDAGEGGGRRRAGGGGRYTFSRAADGPGLKGKNGSNVREDGGAGGRRDVARSGRRKVYPLERPPAREEMEVADLGPQGGRDDGAEPRGGDSSTCEPLGCL